MYKILRKNMSSPFLDFKYELNKKYVCNDFDTDLEKSCSRGFYATDVDGLIYSFSFLQLDNYIKQRVFECEVGGKKVEIDQFKRRYETIKLIREVPHEEVKELAKEEENKVGYKLSEALFPIDPLEIDRKKVTKEDIKLLEEWVLVRNSVWYLVNNSVRNSVWRLVNNSVRNSVGDSVWNSVRDSVSASVGGLVGSSVWTSIEASVGNSVGKLVCYSIRHLVGTSVRNSVKDVMYAYISSFFDIKKWKYIDHEEGKNPFQSGIDLWKRGFVPSFDGKTWRLHAGENAKVLWEGKIKDIT
jgi:hypothetical protein